MPLYVFIFFILGLDPPPLAASPPCKGAGRLSGLKDKIFFCVLNFGLHRINFG
jgi:hypothetical protein